jgi:ABC-type nitrate/sulfonate/bicarbonate transport system permease component
VAIGSEYSNSTNHPLVKAAAPLGVGIGLGLVAWTLISVTSDGWVPSVGEVAESLVQQVQDPDILADIWITARRIFIVFLATLALGLVVGVLMGLSRSARAFLRPFVVTGLAVPDVVYFILAALLLGTEESAALIAMGIAVIPYVINVVASGTEARDPGLDEMSQAYRLRRGAYLWNVVVLQMAPSLLAASRTGFAFTWKLVVLMEAITQPNGIGSRIYLAFRLLRPDEMIALALIFIVIVLIVDKVLFAGIERRLLSWRISPTFRLQAYPVGPQVQHASISQTGVDK